MYNKGQILFGLAVFLFLMTFPLWFNAGNARQLPKPEKPKGYTECVADTQYMRTTHMLLLNDWRDNILRESGSRIGTTKNGTQYVRSLQNGCMKCHANKKKFCDECHTYAAVKPYCWDCHIQPKEAI